MTSANGTKIIDHLSEDDPIASQMWCCISFVSPETVKNCNNRMLKIRGCYATKDEATKRAEYLQSIDPDFNIYVGEVGKWLGWDPDPNTVEDQIYKEQKLQDLMTSLKKNREKAKVLEEERRKEILEESVRNEASKVAPMQDKLRRKLEKNRQEKRTNELIGKNRFKSGQVSESQIKDAEIKEKERIISAEKARISSNEKALNESEQNLSNVDQKLNELQNVYKQLLERKKQTK